MLKRIYSKRSGFTLVEILVAFAIFTIMMSMIMQILQLSLSARQRNNEISRERIEQEEKLIAGKDLTYDGSAGDTGTVSLKFDGKNYEMGYQVKGTVDGDPEYGLNYFVANVDYNASPAAADVKKNKASSGSQMSKYDTRITGTADIGDIDLKVENNGGGRYTFTLKANSANVNSEMQKYTQIRLYFFNDTRIYSDVYEYVDGYVETSSGPRREDIKTYKKCSIPSFASEVGLLSGTKITGKISKDTTNDEILLQGLGNSVRISYYNGSSFDGTEIKFYVQFAEDPGLTSASFGDNGTSNGSFVTYKKYEMSGESGDEVIESNIYGAKAFVTDTTDFGGIWVAGVNDWKDNPGKNVRAIDTTSTPSPAPGGDSTPDTPGGESTPETPGEGGDPA